MNHRLLPAIVGATSAILLLTGLAKLSFESETSPEFNASLLRILGSRNLTPQVLIKKEVLVVFSDFQCPPCQVDYFNLLARAPTSVKIIRRHLPITQIHPFAYELAVDFERNKDRMDTKTLDDIFYRIRANNSSDLTIKLEKLGIIPGLSQLKFSRAERAVAEDIYAADKLKVEGTPAYYLVKFPGRVRQIGRDELRVWLAAASGP